MKKKLVLMIEETSFLMYLYLLWRTCECMDIGVHEVAAAMAVLGTSVLLARLLCSRLWRRRCTRVIAACVKGVLTEALLMGLFFAAFLCIAQFIETTAGHSSLVFLSGLYAAGFMLIDYTLHSMAESIFRLWSGAVTGSEEIAGAGCSESKK